MGAPFHDATHWPGRQHVGIGPGPEGPGSGTVSLEGGAQKSLGADHGHQRLGTALHRTIRPEGNHAPSYGNTRPVRAS